MGLLFAFFAVLLALCLYPVTGFFAKSFALPYRTAKARLVRICIALLCGVIGFLFRIMALAFLHFAILLGLCALLVLVFKKIWKQLPHGKGMRVLRILYRTGAIPLLLVIGILIAGYVNINTVRTTSYTVASAKLTQDYRVVFLSDLHYATVQRESVLEEQVAKINALAPDIVILGGDIVDEGTSLAQMQRCFAVLGNLRATHGIYYIYGNHDRQRYDTSPAYTEAQLAQTIAANGIYILQESAVSFGSDLTLIGREDMGAKGDRFLPNAWQAQLDTGRFLLFADHQPFDAEANALLGADAQLSGHTHGGQIFPLGLLTFFYRGVPYGQYNIGQCDLFVSSGIAGWGFPVRTQGVSEIVVLDLKQA